MSLALLKLLEVLARALFVIAAAYLLPVRGSGQFGLATTLVALFAFGFGWERHIDIQRRLAGHAPRVFDGAMHHLPRFWGFNYLAMSPILFVLGLAMARLDVWQAAALVAIAVVEQQANAAYNFAVVEARYRPLVAIAVVRSCTLLAATVALKVLKPDEFDLDSIMLLWLATGLFASVAWVIAWRRTIVSHREPAPYDNAGEVRIDSKVFDQHRASLFHFLIGGLAVLMIQIDRLVAGALIPLALVGTYYRHVLAVSFVYQFFNVASYNRRLAEIFADAREGRRARALAIVNRETLMLVPVVLAVIAAAWLVVRIEPLATLAAKYAIDPVIVSLLLLGALVRVRADFVALLLNAEFRERRLLVNQLAAFAIGTAAMTALTLAIGIRGTATGALLASAIYLAFNALTETRIAKERAA